jgi:SWI/SNF-related matrix-associated actin-dependent regulator of chromatin subfamily A-like protein 1
VDPFLFQQHGIEWLATRKSALLCDDPGLGKTLQTIRAADKAWLRKILVICPAIARLNWQREFLRWQQRDRTVKAIISSKDAADADVIIVSYSLLVSPKVREVLGRGRYELLTLDEAQNLKSPDAARTRAVYGASGLITRSSRCWLLSGTIAPNHAGELWTHLHALRLTALGYWDFVNRYCTIRETAFGKQIVGTNRTRSAELAAILKPHVLRRRQKDVLQDLPPLRWGHVVVAPDDVPPRPELTIEEQAILGRIERGEAISVTDSSHLASLRRWVGTAKAPAVAELLQADLESIDKIVVFAHHREVITTVAKALGKDAATIHGDTPIAVRQQLIDAFQTSDQPRVLIVQISIGGTALTLTRSSHVVFAELSWVPADNVQAAKRCHRIGQSNPVLARVISLAGSIDEVVAAIVTRKAAELAELEGHLTQKVA